MVFFTEIRPTRHYEIDHKHEVPWSEVIAAIFATKHPRKKGAVYEIENSKYYILFTIRDRTLYVINAKRR